MDPDFWRARWAAGRIGFHQPHPNPRLVAHAAVLAEARRVLVPLCGKTVDLAWLAAREPVTSVVGIELVEDAARAFFEEQGIASHRTHDGPFVRYEGRSIEIVVGDFFEVTTAEVGRFDGCFDRAALVALPAEMRARYVEHLRTLLEPGAKVLLVTFEHDAPAGPPFSVPEAEVRTLWAGCAITRLETVPLEDGSLFERGARTVSEVVFAIETPA